MKKRLTVIMVPAVMMQAITGCTFVVPGIGLIAVVDWTVIAGVATVLGIIVGAVVLFTRRS